MPAFMRPTPSSKVPILKAPSRLREVQSSDSDEAFALVPSAMHTVAVGKDVAYTLGDEISQYAQALASAKDGELFGDTGLLAQYYSIGQQKSEEALEQDPDSQSCALWDAESRTWDLIQRLYVERTKEVMMPNINHQYHSNRHLEQQYYEQVEVAAETRAVLEWLRDGYPAQPTTEVRGNRWFNTKESIKSRKRLGKLSQADQIVTELDPDACLRQGRRLTDEDHEYERQLMREIFALVRSGEFKEAANLSRLSGNHWRAASLQGIYEFENTTIETGIASDSIAEGTSRKALWRRMCYALSRQNGIDVYERALYGAMCGDLASVLPVCNTWEDLLWAHVNAIDQAQLEDYLASKDRIDLDRTFVSPERGIDNISAVLDSLAHCEQDEVRMESLSPMRVIQARVITGQVDGLLNDIHLKLKQVRTGAPSTAASSPHVIRFVTHLILALRAMNVALPEDAANSIIQAYVELMVSTEQSETVALYASQLPNDLAIESLARFWSTVEAEDVRRDQLRLAHSLGLDINTTMLRSVEMVYERTLEVLPVGDAVQEVNSPLLEEEAKCIRALEWLRLDDTLQKQLIILGNVLFRRFLLAGRPRAGNELDLRLPDTALIPQDMVMEEESEDGSEDDLKMRNAIEYVGYCTLVRALARYEDWKTLIRQRPQEVNGRRDPVGLRQWKTDLAHLQSLCIATLREILEGNWCDPDELGLEPTEGMIYILQC